jgi:hypothetical protein
VKIVFVGKIPECKSISVFFVEVESISSLVLAPHDIVHNDRCGNHDAVKDDESSPELGIVSATSLALDELRTNDVPDTVGNKDSGRHEAFLGRACHIRHAQSNDERDDGTKEADFRVSYNWSGSMVCPVCFPDQAAASYDGQTANDQNDDSDVSNVDWYGASKQDTQPSDTADRKL